MSKIVLVRYRDMFLDISIDHVLTLKVDSNELALKSSLLVKSKRLVPRNIKPLLRNTAVKPSLDNNQLGFRVYLVGQPNIFTSDAGGFSQR